jgi:hypothetical protein
VISRSDGGQWRWSRSWGAHGAATVLSGHAVTLVPREGMSPRQDLQGRDADVLRAGTPRSLLEVSTKYKEVARV